ncbi:MAG: TIGR04211 family SH3 domain-containing protein, partial [Deltaproteobacteria bacterium]|nr:TIGR04211 family SH3 domain-containing protein [Deltaproteobacteria bacterium]
GAYSKIRTAQGVEGWVSQQYITTQRPKAEIIKELNGEIDSLASRIGSLKSSRRNNSGKAEKYRAELAKVRDENQQLTRERDAVTEKYTKLAEQAEDVSRITTENARITAEHAQLEKEARQLRSANKRPRPPAMFWWFLAGATVFVLGLITGIYTRKKKFYLDI